MSDRPDTPQDAPSNPRFKWVLMGFVAIAGFLLFTEHQAHVIGALPYLILLACPLMHLFMHRGHGHHAGHGEHARRSEERSKGAES